MAKIREREKALSLRKKGKSIRDIATSLNVSKSTVSYWCRNIVLSKGQIKRLAQNQKRASAQAFLTFVEKKRRKRLSDIKRFQQMGAKDVGKLTKRELFILGLGLYWGEGYKKGSKELGFTNSDPNMIKIFIRWMETIYGTKKDDFILRVSINEIHRNRVSEVTRFWSRVAGVPVSQFTKTSLIKSTSKKIYTNHKKHFGTLRVKVRRGTNLRRRILGSIDALNKN